jgi:Asp-tRNA(Asn)/Glu-tRNA(Gln) amidotransferase A subunit family amidase
VGLQIICPAFEEYKMLNIANLIHNVWYLLLHKYY